jgi:hypothetical protein
MPKNKFSFWHEFCVLRLVFVLVVGLCASLWAQDKDISSQQKLDLQKISRLLPQEAKTCLPPDLWTSEKPQESNRLITATGSISGLVTNASGGGGIANVIVRAHLCECPSYSNYDTTDNSGYYIIPDLPAGEYTVWTDNDSIYTDVYYDDKTSQNPDTVTVGTDTTTGIDFSLRVGAIITGKLTLTGSPYVSAFIMATDTLTNKTYDAQPYGFAGDTATYTIKRLPTGQYKLKTMNSLGYIDEYFDDKSTWASATTISVTEGTIYSGKNITLSKGAIIKGTVNSSAKGPLKSIQLWAQYVPDKFEWTNMGFTNTSGQYWITGLRSGDWKVFCYGDTTYAWEWYDNASSWNGAATISVTAPDSVSGKDFSLEVGGSISGHVYGQGANPLAGGHVMAFDTSYFWSGLGVKGTQTDGSGYYKIKGLRTGSYYVEAYTECSMQFYNHKSTMQLADTVSVTMPSEHSGIDFNLSTAVEDEEEMAQRPSEFELYQNYPNPFNPGTKIEYALKKTGHVTLYIYNVLGEKVKTLLDQDQHAGFYRIDWDGKNDNGKSVSSGIYLYKLEVNGFSEAKRMLLLK